jgi:hypothetical protein
MDEAPCRDRDTLEDALACLNWSQQYHDRALALVSQTARRLDRQAQIKRNVRNHRNKAKTSAPPAQRSA